MTRVSLLLLCGGLALAPGRVEFEPTRSLGNVQGETQVRRPIVILGASYAGGWQLRTIAGREVINRGVQGQQSAELLGRFERDVVAQRPSAVIIWGFINDIFRTSPERIETALAGVRTNYEQMIRLARANDIEPILATEVTITAPGSWSEYFASWVGWVLRKESHDAWINKQVLSTNQWLRDLAARERLLILDLQPVLSGPAGRRKREFAAADGSHIPPAGYAALTSAVTPVLERHFSRQSQPDR